MKLISKTSTYYLLISLPLIIIAGILSFYLIKNELLDGIDEALLTEKSNAEALISKFNVPQNVYISADSMSNIKAVESYKSEIHFSNTSIFDSTTQEVIEYRRLESYFKSKDKNYVIHISKTTFEEEELLEGLLIAFILVVAFLITSFLIVNLWISKILWKPFHSTLTELNNYDIKRQQKPFFKSSNINEFRELNSSLNMMTEKIHSDFLQQKEFTENAAHEMQTPLAIVKANVSLLLQSPNLKEDEMNQLHSIENTIKKWSALNKSLILLTKIENNQFAENTLVDFNDVINKTFTHCEDLIVAKKIQLEIKTEANISLKMNLILAEILISNLFKNAIRHNDNNGKVAITLSHQTIIFSNSGSPLNISEEELFVRFKKNDTSNDSLGLGLSIVQSITKLYNIGINYDFNNNMHHFTLKFK
jgi:signal transduction histidine kinase